MTDIKPTHPTTTSAPRTKQKNSFAATLRRYHIRFLRIHREGKAFICSMLFFMLLMNWTMWRFVPAPWLNILVGLACLFIAGVVINFFRAPNRINPRAQEENLVFAPADGKLVTIEEVFEPIHIKDTCLKVSVFMSVTDVHVNWPSVAGVVKHSEHIPGNFYKAFLPKSSTENERSAVLIETKSGHRVLEQQIAGAMARRIVTYLIPGRHVTPNDHLGFIKLGSRVDLYLPLGTVIDIPIGSMVKGNTTILGRMPEVKAEEVYTL